MNYYANKNYVLRSIGGEHMLITIGDAVRDFRGIITLNDTAAYLWKLLVKGSTAEEMSQALTKHFNVPADQAAMDVNETLAMLEKRSMVRIIQE